MKFSAEVSKKDKGIMGSKEFVSHNTSPDLSLDFIYVV